jgi:hypothetical protein
MNLQRRLREHLKHYAAANEAADRIDELEAQLSARCSADSALSSKQRASKILFGDPTWLDRPDMAEQMDDEFVEDNGSTSRRVTPNQLIAELSERAVPQTAPSDIERAFQDACDEAGCAYDNEALLEAIHALKERCQAESDK